MQRLREVVGWSVVVAVGLLFACFLFVGACLLDETRPVGDCRDNTAGQIVAALIRPFFTK